MSICQIEEKDAGRAYSRTCPTCGLGSCTKGLGRKSLLARIRTLEAENAALREARGVRVKPLVWKKEIPSANPSYSPNIAWTEFGLIYANEHAFWFEGEEAVKCQGCRETTKAAAQADYERRILAALEPAPVTVGEAARVLLALDADGTRRAVHDACAGRVKVYKFDAVLSVLADAGEAG